jgi:putative DNA primase/helicase
MPFFPWKQYQQVRPSLDDIRQWEQRYRPSAWAVITGNVSNIITLDFDGPQGCETIKRLGLKPHRSTPSGGYHVDFIHPGWPVSTVNSRSKMELGERWSGLDIRGDGGYALCIGRIDKGEYIWLRDPEPEDLSILPTDLREFLGLLYPPGTANNTKPLLTNGYYDSSRVDPERLIRRALEQAPADGRNNRGFWLALQLRDNGYSQAEAEACVLDYRSRCHRTNTKGQPETYSEYEALSSVRKAFEGSQREPWGKPAAQAHRNGTVVSIVQPTTEDTFSEPAFPGDNQPSDGNPPEFPLTADSLNDHGNAQRLIAMYGKDLRYCHPMKSWLDWDGKRWKPDTTGQARRKAKLAMVEFYKQAISANNETAQKAQKFAQTSLDDKRITALLKMAESDIYVEPDQLDSHALLVNFQNGTFDVSTGELREHRREDFLTKLIHYDFVPESVSESWQVFLDKIMGGGPDASQCDIERAERMVRYLQRALGYSLTGNVREKSVFMCFGTGNNGKSTMLTVVRSLTPEYSVQLDINTLMVRQETNNTQSDLARLRGARFAQTSETEEGQRLAEGKLKRITQGMPDGKITATRKYENAIEFNETHKLWMDCNHRPVIRGTESAIWNRLHLIPFTITIPDDEIDPELPRKLKAEAEGILAWLMAGAMAWYRSGLERPREMQTASDQYRSEMDPLKEFIEDRCDLGSQFSVTSSSRLYAAYTDWAQENHEQRVIDNKTFKRLLEARGCIYHRLKSGQKVEGIGFKPSSSTGDKS